jgi:alpha-D-ribose 1-methylphosphonate 5-triphosphate synthase subunit PhnL
VGPDASETSLCLPAATRNRSGSGASTRPSSQQVLQIRNITMGYVSQFLRVIPRVSAVDVVSEPLRIVGIDPEVARARAETLLAVLNMPKRLWEVAPATFSGGEQQRVNIARSFVFDYPILLLDEPTARRVRSPRDPPRPSLRPHR